MLFLSKNRTYGVCIAISMIIALGSDVARSHANADSHEEVTSVSAVKQASADTTDENHNHTDCNRPAPDYPLDFASVDDVSIVDKNLVIPAQPRKGKDPSGFTALAMVFDGQELSKVALKPSWGLLDSKGILQIPIASIARKGAKGDKPITFAIEVTDASKSSRWSDPMQIERVGNKWTVRAHVSDFIASAVRVNSATELQGEIPRVASRRPPLGMDELLSRLETVGVSSNLLAKLEDIEAPVERSAATTAESIQGSEAMSSGSITNICLSQIVLMNDEGVGEDYLAFDGLWPSAGMFVYIIGPSVYTLAVLDEWGCLPLYDITSGWYYVYALSMSSAWLVSDSIIGAVTHSNGELAMERFTITYLEAGEDYWIPWWPANLEHFNTNLFAVYGLHFNPDIETVQYIFNIQSSEAENRNISFHENGEVHLRPDDGQSKWTVVHEMGHAFQYLNTTNQVVFDYGIDAPDPCGSPPDPVTGNDTHGIHSKEYATSAFAEGFAHFYGAAAFNSMDEPEICLFDNPPHPYNCANGEFNSPQPYMENECVQPWDDMGVEIDWTRTLWGVRTGGPWAGWGFYRTPMNDILEWLDTAGAFTKDNAYDVLDTAADTMGGTLKTNWTWYKQLNGITH